MTRHHVEDLDDIVHQRFRFASRGRAGRTRLAITTDGRSALTAHVAALRRIIDGIPGA